MTTFEPSAETCSSCSAPVIWCITENAKTMPVDAEPAANGNLALQSRGQGVPPLARVLRRDLAFGRTDLHVSHFVTCPDAQSWRKRRAP